MAPISRAQFLPKEACLEVIDILALFDHLIRSLERLPDKRGLKESDVRFRGFDSHSDDEVGYWHYAIQLVENQRRFKTLVSELKGYSPMLSKYREAIQLWGETKARRRTSPGAADPWLQPRR